MNKKNIIFGIVITVVVIALLGLTFALGEKDSKNSSSTNLSNNAETVISNAQKESEAASKENYNALPTINMEQYMNYYVSEENNLVLVARPTCMYCNIAEPIIKKLASDYNITINYLNTDEFSEEDNQNFVQHNEQFKDGYGTPMLLLVSNNNIVDMVDGLTDTAHYIEFFKGHGFIKE